MTPIKFSPEALEDLQSIRQYIAGELGNEQAAANTVAKVMKRVKELAMFPEMGAPLSARIKVATDYRYLVCGNYTAFYRLESCAVLVVRVLYGRRDFMKTLFGEPNDN